MKRTGFHVRGAVVGAAFAFPLVTAVFTQPQHNSPASAIAIDADDIAGVVTSLNGPEAGVWVIAETSELPTKFTRIVVTDDQGRYLLPDRASSSSC